MPPAVGLMKKHAEEIMGLLEEAGVADMPVGVDLRRDRDVLRAAEGGA